DGMKTQQEFGSAFTPKLMEKHDLVGQGLGAEMIADQWEIPRSELDELALRSHQLAAKATEDGRFERETVPFKVNGSTYVADLGRVNPRGGAMALGHPLGSTGARLLTTLLHELEDDDKEIGLVTMCCGGGLGTATLVQRV